MRCPCDNCLARRQRAAETKTKEGTFVYARNGLFSGPFVVQPMTVPAGAVFYLDYRYGDAKKEEAEPWIDF
jgi:hypothetical protein